jgi:LCP family protein required for cell wall assembly
MAKIGRYQQQKVKKGGVGRKIFLSVLFLLIFLVVGGITAGALYYNSMLNLVTRPEVAASENILSDDQLKEILGYVPEKLETDGKEAPSEPEELKTLQKDTKGVQDNVVNIMLIGQQAREKEVAKLSDTMILCSINKETKTITLTSFLRDLYVKLPDFQGHICGKNRINVAYNLGWYWAGEKGGMEMLDQLILENFGVEIDYNVEIGFDAFTSVIDILGGVDMELTADEARYMRIGSKEGMYHLDGNHALIYARTRHSNAGDNDFNRTNRQRKLITHLLDKCRTMSLPDLHNLLKQILPLVITDMTNEEITQCALELLPMLVDLKIESNQVPAEGTYWFDMLDIIGVESSVIICDLEKNGELLAKIAEPHR